MMEEGGEIWDDTNSTEGGKLALYLAGDCRLMKAVLRVVSQLYNEREYVSSARGFI
jgi:hypothetical protein